MAASTAPTPVQERSNPVVATAADAQGYAAREKQSAGLQDFKGGEGYIYIGGGVLTAVLLILLILILV